MKRIIAYILLILAAFMLQNNFFAAIKWIDCTPNLLLIITFMFGLIRGKLDGMLIGFASGLLTDFFFGARIGYYALIYMAIGYGNGIIGGLFYMESSLPVVLLGLMSDFIFNIYVFLTGFLLKGASDFGYYLKKIILPEMVYTLLLVLILYKPVRALSEWLEKTEKKKAKKFV
ncbi:MAG: rod shape-determining protein MreD [Lachnospiraceae bacterium]|nr:rod shape-determining protein MreD [Lachnospiraceae bacterium]